MSRPVKRTVEEKQAALDAVLQQLSDGVEAIRSSEGWRGWLDASSRLHQYSARNAILIWMQMPEASVVAGFNAWKGFDRHVLKGERALRVLAPIKRNVELIDGDGRPLVDENGKTRKDSRVVGFRDVAVFDISQTDGAPFPLPPAPVLLEGQAPDGLWDALAAQVDAAGYQLERVDSAEKIGGANGRTNYAARTVTVRSDVSDAQAVKTLAHELAHVKLHDPSSPDVAGSGPCRGAAEVEAESVAYLVAAAHGMDTANYSFTYVATWASHAAPDVMLSTASRVRNTAADILHTITTPDLPAEPVLEVAAPALAAAISTSSAVPALAL